LAGTGIRRNPEESGGIQSKYRNSYPTGIPAKKIMWQRQKTGIPATPSKTTLLWKIPLENTGKKRNPQESCFFLFLSPQNRFLSNRNRQPSLRNIPANVVHALTALKFSKANRKHDIAVQKNNLHEEVEQQQDHVFGARIDR
jgi:hypothetical protein